MRTARSSSRSGGSPPGTPPEPDPPGTRPPWTMHTPQNQAPPPRDQTPPGPGTSHSRGQTHIYKHITLPQTSFAGGNNGKFSLPNENVDEHSLS